MTDRTPFGAGKLPQPALDLTPPSPGVPSSGTGQMRAAKLMALTRADNLRFAHGLHGGVWLYWDGMRWKPDSANHARAALFPVIDHHMPLLVAAGLLPQTSLNEMQRNAAQVGALEIARHLPEFSTELEHLDAQPHLLNCTNGTLDLETLELRPADPGDLTSLHRPCEVSQAPWQSSGVSL